MSASWAGPVDSWSDASMKTGVTTYLKAPGRSAPGGKWTQRNFWMGAVGQGGCAFERQPVRDVVELRPAGHDVLDAEADEVVGGPPPPPVHGQQCHPFASVDGQAERRGLVRPPHPVRVRRHRTLRSSC